MQEIPQFEKDLKAVMAVSCTVNQIKKVINQLQKNKYGKAKNFLREAIEEIEDIARQEGAS